MDADFKTTIVSTKFVSKLYNASIQTLESDSPQTILQEVTKTTKFQVGRRILFAADQEI